MLAAISIFGAVKSAATIALIVPAIALGLPIMDTAFAIVRRYTNGRPIFQPDKGHLHHRLLAMGMTQRQAVLLDVYHQCYTWYCCSIADRGWRLLCGNNYSAYYYSRSFRCEKIGILNDR